MKKFFTLALTTIICISLTSCLKDPDAILTNVYSFASVKADRIVTDEGIEYVVAEDGTDKMWNMYDRIFIHNDVLRRCKDGTYEIRLIEYAKADSRFCIDKVDYPDDIAGTEPAAVYESWGFDLDTKKLNLSFLFGSEDNLGEDHVTNLVFDSERSATSDTVFLRLAHQGWGDVMTEDNAKDYHILVGYTTFDLTEAFEGRRGNIPVVIEYDWYKSSGSSLTPELQHHAPVTIFPID